MKELIKKREGLKIFKFRASSLDNLKFTSNELTERQLLIFKELEEKLKRTDKQEEEFQKLKEKMETAPELTTGAKSYLMDVYTEYMFDRSNFLFNDATIKGNLKEDLAIELVRQQAFPNIPFLLKNEIRFENEYIAGTPDVLNTKTGLLLDIKCSETLSSFIDVDGTNQLYHTQLQAYSWLTGCDDIYLCYALVNTPEHILEGKLNSLIYKFGDVSELYNKVYQDIIKANNFDDIPEELRVKIFKIEKEIGFDKKIIKLVEAGREYLFNNCFINKKYGI